MRTRSTSASSGSSTRATAARPVQRRQRQQDPLGRARDRVQPRDPPVARPRDARVGRQRRRRRAQRRRRLDLGQPERDVSTNLFRGLDIGRGSPTNNIYAYTGTQDTGTIGHQPGDAGRDWHLGIDGDGGLVAVDWCDPQHVIGTDNGGYSQPATAATPGAAAELPAGTSLATRLRPALRDRRRQPHRLLRRHDQPRRHAAGDYPDQPLPQQRQQQQLLDHEAFASSTGRRPITAIATSPLDSNIVWVGFNDGTIQRTADALQGSTATWTPWPSPVRQARRSARSRSTRLTRRSRSRRTRASPRPIRRRPDEARLPHHRQRLHVTDVSGLAGGGAANYPDLPTHSVVIDPGTSPHSIIVSNDAGVMRSLDNGHTWQRLGVGLPTVDSTQLALDYGADPPVLRVGTYGRSSFQLTTPTGPVLAVNTDLGFGNVGWASGRHGSCRSSTSARAISTSRGSASSPATRPSRSSPRRRRRRPFNRARSSTSRCSSPRPRGGTCRPSSTSRATTRPSRTTSCRPAARA